MKQTAVDYLIQELFTVHDENFDFNPVFEKAKDKIFENQIIDARDALFHGTPEQYYNETFKSE
jgi:hypothetical protein